MFAPKIAPRTRAAAPLRAWASCLGIGLALAAGFENAPAQTSTSAATKGIAIVQHGGYPELRVDGRPFFLHSAAFFYDRIPRDLWSSLLDRYREFGINTIDIYIPWNWHEPKEGEFDFDGHTNPRRDLRGLLQLIALKGFRLVARPGPQILNEWRHGGYPGWLLERPEYNMDLVDRLEGRYPPLSYLNTRNAEAGAQGWLANATHMAQTRIWLGTVAKELAPYSSRRSVPIAPAQDTGPRGAPEETNGPLLFVQLEDDMAIGRTNTIGPAFWRYMESLRGMLEAGGLDVPFFINPTDMRVSAAGAALADPIDVMGQWYMPPRTEAETGVREITAEDTSTMEFFVEELKTQPAFPPMLIEYQAGWYCPGDDDRPLESPPENTLLSSRLLLANGLKGISYFPLQDTYTPAGYSVPWANHSYRWDAAFDPDGNEQPRADAIRRNGQLLQQWGEVLAGTHKRADFGIVYSVGAFPQETLKREDILRVSYEVMQLERLGALASLASELLDPEYQPVDELLHNAVILLPVFDPGQPQFQFSKKSQDALVEYVRRGGTLVYFPTRPAGDSFQALWQARSPASTSPSDVSSARPARWTFGAGQAIEATKDFYSWIAPEQDFSQNLNRTEAEDSLQILRSFMSAAGVRPTIEHAAGPPDSREIEIVATQLVSNEGTGVLGARTGGQGFLSVTNLSAKPVEEVLRVLSPRASARRATSADNSHITLHLTVPARESFLLPLEEPLCSGAPPSEPCRDSLVSAEAELTRTERKGKTLELSFYAPARAQIDLSFEKKPSHASLDGNSLEAGWDKSQRRFHVVVPRGAAPRFLRVLKIELPYTPRMPEKPKAPRNTPSRVYDYSLTSAMRLPSGGHSALASFPPLAAIEANRPVDLFFEFHNLTEETRRVDVKVEGPLHGSGELALPSGGWGILKVKLKAASGRKFTEEDLRPESDGFIHSTLEIRADQDRRSMPMDFLLVREGKTNRYEFDFDRDGANERVLENTHLRLIISPESGGRALALLDKSSGSNLISSVGALRDNFSFAENPPGARPERARGRYGLFNRAYKADWMDEQGNPALHMSYDAPDVLPFGAHVEKMVRLASSEEIRVDYRIGLDGRAGEHAVVAKGSPPQSFVAVNSVPALSESGNSTRFCWFEPTVLGPGSEPASQTGDRDSSRTSPTKHCEDFVAGGAPLVLPESTREVKMFTPGRPGLTLKWQEGRMTIERKNFSALLRLEFPPLTPGGDPGIYSMSFRVLASEEKPAE
jgi:hypothetical protein